jgi:hypothetical protein
VGERIGDLREPTLPQPATFSALPERKENNNVIFINEYI